MSDDMGKSETPSVSAFDPLREEFKLWQQSGRRCSLWWRDDDLVADTPALRRMAELAQRHQVPVLVAVIPGQAADTLAEDTAAMSMLSFCQHGWQHQNHESAGTPSEFGTARPLEEVAEDLRRGYERMAQLFGSRFFPVFVPPWNRVREDALPLLRQVGLYGVSQHTGQPAATAVLPAFDTHVDILQWAPAPPMLCRPVDELVERLVAILREWRSQSDPMPPLGLLTHHRPMQDDAWAFMEQLIAVTREFDCVHWLAADEFFVARAKSAYKAEPAASGQLSAGEDVPSEVDARPRPTKGDVINRLIRQYGLKRYLEYNKFDGATYYEQISCEHKEIAYLPERSYLDAGNLRRLLDVAQHARTEDILPLDQLFERYRDQRFDIIFFDPVHQRPDVDHALQLLPRLLKPGGFLVVHDCNPGLYSQTTLQRKPDSWVGETYKAFAVFRAHNRARTITIDEDFGVGLIWNVELDLDYTIDFDVDYFRFADHREEYIGLIAYEEFLARTAEGGAARLFEQPPPVVAMHLLPKLIADEGDGPPPPWDPAAPQPYNGARWANSQLFWRSGGGDFSERKSAERPLCFDGRTQLLYFVLADLSGTLEGLRFDFADSRGLVRLDGIRLKNAQGVLKWRWDGSRGPLQDAGNLMFIEVPAPASGLFMLATSADPRVMLVLPAEVSAAVRPGWLLEVELTPLPDYLQGVFAELASLRQLSARIDQLEQQALRTPSLLPNSSAAVTAASSG